MYFRNFSPPSFCSIILLVLVSVQNFDAASAQGVQSGCQSVDTVPTCQLSLPDYDSDSISPPVDAAFVGFAFEERSILYYAGGSGKPNVFSQNLINEVAKRTNTQPVIRVGGTSCDYSSYNPYLKVPVKYPKGQRKQSIPINITLGPSFFDSFANFPNAEYVFSVPLATNNLPNTVEFAQAGYNTISEGSNIFSISIGNEPNVYHRVARPESYGPADWVSEFITYSNAISDALNVSRSTPLYDAEGLAASVNAGGASAQMSLWNQQVLFDDGLGSIASRIKSVSMHYYQTVANHDDADLDEIFQTNLMNHTSIVNNMTYYKEPIQYLQNWSIPLNLGEVGSVINKGSNKYQFEGFFGAALWQVDFLLYAMSLGIHRVNMQQGIGFAFAMWQPVTWDGQPAHVRAPYYAQIFAADFLGPNPSFLPSNESSTNSSSDGVTDYDKLQVANIDLNQDMLSAYAAYSSNTNRLTKIVLVNLEMWSPVASGLSRPSVNFTLTNLSNNTQSLTLMRLTSPLGAMASDSIDITWAGQSWNFDALGLAQQVTDGTEVVDVFNGTAEVMIAASEAIMLYVLYDDG